MHTDYAFDFGTGLFLRVTPVARARFSSDSPPNLIELCKRLSVHTDERDRKKNNNKFRSLCIFCIFFFRANSSSTRISFSSLVLSSLISGFVELDGFILFCLVIAPPSFWIYLTVLPMFILWMAQRRKKNDMIFNLKNKIFSTYLQMEIFRVEKSVLFERKNRINDLLNAIWI